MPVWFILDDYDVVFLTEIVYPLLTLDGQSRSRWILSGATTTVSQFRKFKKEQGNSRNSIQHMRPPSNSKIPIIKNISQAALSRNAHTLRIHSDTNNIETPRLGGLNSIHIRKLLAKNTLPLTNPISLGIPDIRKRFNRLAKAIGRPTVKNNIGPSRIWHVRMEMITSELAEEGD